MAAPDNFSLSQGGIYLTNRKIIIPNEEDNPIRPHPLADPLEHRIYLPDRKIVHPEYNPNQPNQPGLINLPPYGLAPDFNARQQLNGGLAY